MDLITIIGLFLVALLAFANGSNDVSKAIATLVGSGVTDYPKAILWGTLWTVLGSLLAAVFSFALVKTFTNGIVSSTMGMTAIFPIATAIGAIGWVLFATRTGLPVSTTHAILGAMMGAGLVAFGAHGILWPSLTQKVVLPLLVSPLIALAVMFLAFPFIRWTVGSWKGYCLCLLPIRRAVLSMDERGALSSVTSPTEIVTVAGGASDCGSSYPAVVRLSLDSFHWLTSGLASFTRGLNDAPKIAALVIMPPMLLGSSTVPLPTALIFLIVALMMGLGSYLGGLRVTEVLAQKVTKMDHVEGFLANLTTAFLVATAARFGLPVSTTHVSASAIIGIGLKNGRAQVNWKIVREILLAWVVTLPASAVLSAGVYFLLNAVWS